MADCIINKPHLQSTGQRVVYRGIWLLFWSAWLYLCAPLGEMAYRLLNDWAASATALNLLGEMIWVKISLTATVLAVVIVTWSFSRLLFAQGRRQQQVAPVSPEAAANANNLEVEAVEILRGARRAVVHFAHNGGLAAMETTANVVEGVQGPSWQNSRVPQPTRRDVTKSETLLTWFQRFKARQAAMNAVFGECLDESKGVRRPANRSVDQPGPLMNSSAGRSTAPAAVEMIHEIELSDSPSDLRLFGEVQTQNASAQSPAGNLDKARHCLYSATRGVARTSQMRARMGACSSEPASDSAVGTIGCPMTQRRTESLACAAANCRGNKVRRASKSHLRGSRNCRSTVVLTTV